MVPAPWPEKAGKGVEVEVEGVKVDTGRETERSRSSEPARTAAEPAPASSSASTVTFSAPAPSPREVGAVMAPAALPAGALAVYGILGAPEVGGGYRQGFPGVELEARALFNYLELSGVLEAGVRVGVFKNAAETLAIAPAAAIGLKLNSGAKYYDTANFGYAGLRLRGAVNVTYKLSDTIVGLGVVDVPWVIALGKAGFQLTPTVGVGAEFHLGERLSLAASLHGGFDTIKEPMGVTQWRAAWAIHLGVGYRLF